MNRARLWRKQATDPERHSLASFAEPQLCRLQIYRQHPLDCYILDFYCPTAKLAIELDGGGHNYRSGQIRDRARSAFLARKGIVVCDFGIIRFAGELDSVLRAIWFALQDELLVQSLTLILSLCKRERRIPTEPELRFSERSQAVHELAFALDIRRSILDV